MTSRETTEDLRELYDDFEDTSESKRNNLKEPLLTKSCPWANHPIPEDIIKKYSNKKFINKEYSSKFIQEERNKLTKKEREDRDFKQMLREKLAK